MREGVYPLVLGRPVNADPPASASSPDGDVIARFLAGERAAFDELFERYRDYVYNIVYGIVGRADEARDVTQEVFLQVYRSLGSFRRGSRFATWLYRIAVNRALDATRSEKRRRWQSIDECGKALPDAAPTPEQAAARGAERDEVQRILMGMPPKQREVIVLRYYQELDIEEIAAILGCSTTAAKVRLHRARMHFKERYLVEHGDASDDSQPVP